MPANFDFFLPDDQADDGPYFPREIVSPEPHFLRRPEEFEEAVEPDEIRMLGTYTVDAFTSTGELIDLDNINILDNLTFNIMPESRSDKVQFIGFYGEDVQEMHITYLSEKNPEALVRVDSFGEVPADFYAITSYEAPKEPAILVRWNFDVTYNGIPGISYFYVFILTNYCYLNDIFINDLLKLNKDVC